MSLIVREAMDQYSHMRSEYQLRLEASYLAADAYCRTILLNARGVAHGIDPISLFYGTAARAYAYASDELRDFWEREQPRLTVETFERQWVEAGMRDTAYV